MSEKKARANYFMPYLPTVHILLATYNGAKYLPEQLDSIARQTYKRWSLTVSDDGSHDGTQDIVKSFADRVQQPVRMLQGPSLGSSTHNFFHLIQQAPADSVQDLYAFCDQDDVWLDHKLERAVAWHAKHLSQQVRLYCGRTQFVNEQLQPIGLSPDIKRPPSFGNALVQNIASGNTMVFSHAVLISQQKVQPQHSIWHDWTTYLVVTALAGEVRFEDLPCLLYRQHQGNVVGSNNSVIQLLSSIKLSLNGRYQFRISKNLLALKDLQLHESKMVQEQSSLVANLRASRAPLRRLQLLNRSKLRRQGWLSNAGLWIATLLGKL